MLLQLATSSTSDDGLLGVVADITARIDADFSTIAHQPVMFLMQDTSFPQYLALLACADALMITSLREGLGLTAQEFIFAQDGALTEKRHGPVILSEFTGAAALFGGNELSINPFDYQKCADSIKQALEMEDDEKARRYDKLHKAVMLYTGQHWAEQLRGALKKAYVEQTQRNASTIPRMNVPALCEAYKAAQRRLFIFDFEGTLAHYGPERNTFVVSIKNVVDTLNSLLSDRRNTVYVMSARTHEQLSRFFQHVPSIGLIAENGCFLREYGTTDQDWISFADPDEVDAWMSDVEKTLNYYKESMEGSWIEHRNFSLLLHCDQVEDPEGVKKNIGDCITQINDSFDSVGVHAIPIKSTNSVLVESMDFSKGTAGAEVLERLSTVSSEFPPPDFLMVAGDDRDDEPAFRWANELGLSGAVKHVTTVGMDQRSTDAQSTLTQGPAGLLSALQKLSRISQETSTADYFDRHKVEVSQQDGDAADGADKSDDEDGSLELRPHSSFGSS